NLGMLFLFKYFNFFIDTFKVAFDLPEVVSSLDIILPVGISFYTFQTMSYTIDVYRRQLEPTRNLVHFLAFVGFFPQLVAGPIERAKALLPQIALPRIFSHDQAVIGCRFILFGAFKKIVIADRIGPIVNAIFNSPEQFGGILAFAGLALFFMQIYCDFSGYSDIAIGTAKLFNIHLMLNFDRPFFSTSLRQFWGRWHISLMTWFRDYLYIPMGGNRGTKWFAARNVLITFLLSGLWHGANWNFVIWGLWHGLFLVIEQRSGFDKFKLPGLLKWCIVMFPFTISMVFFRAETLQDAIGYLQVMFTSGSTIGELSLLIRRADITIFSFFMTIAFIILLMLIEKLSFGARTVDLFLKKPVFRYATYALLIASIGLFGVLTETEAFIYFQF
nr:MBOAT family protein [Bacteroidota bacterium]